MYRAYRLRSKSIRIRALVIRVDTQRHYVENKRDTTGLDYRITSNVRTVVNFVGTQFVPQYINIFRIGKMNFKKSFEKCSVVFDNGNAVVSSADQIGAIL